jgi:hypothetical protein
MSQRRHRVPKSSLRIIYYVLPENSCHTNGLVYVVNKMGMQMFDGPREKAMRETYYRRLCK